MNIVLLGPPGAGKGTQAKVLSKKLNILHISTGDILRQNVASGTELGKEAKDYMNKGLLVPDELVTKMVISRIEMPDAKLGFLLDGYPRNLNQAEALDKLLKERSIKIDYAIDLVTSEEIIVQRLSGRLACKGCNANFHITNMPPKKANLCDNCGGILYQRSDDMPETIKKRLEVYKNESAPLIKFYQNKKNLHSVSANEDAGIVLEKIMQLVK